MYIYRGKNICTNAFLKRGQGMSVGMGIDQGLIFFKHKVTSGFLFLKAFTLITNTSVSFQTELCSLHNGIKPSTHFSSQWADSIVYIQVKIYCAFFLQHSESVWSLLSLQEINFPTSSAEQAAVVCCCPFALPGLVYFTQCFRCILLIF